MGDEFPAQIFSGIEEVMYEPPVDPVQPGALRMLEYEVP